MENYQKIEKIGEGKLEARTISSLPKTLRQQWW